MTNYSFNFKLKIIQKYLDGKKGIIFLLKKYDVKSDKVLDQCVLSIRRRRAVFRRKRHNQNYFVQFKFDAVKLLPIFLNEIVTSKPMCL